MRDFDENSITDAVLQRLAGAEDPRLRQVAQSLVKHLHGFVRDVEPSFEEWQAAISFLTRIGHMCDGKRQEFILLSDTLGVSMLVDAINHRMPAGATPTTVLGPFYVEGAPELPLGAEVARAMKGEALHVSGRVSTAGGGPIAGAIVDIWHSDEDGYYDVQRADQPDANLRARFRTDAEGRFHFWTLTPTSYPVPDDGPVGELLRATGRHPMRPAHVHFMIAAPGHETLVTHVFVAGDPYLDSDAVFGVKQELIAEFTQYPPGEGPDGKVMNATWRKLEYDFALKRND
ncbi:MAG: intradiol ring-cleavage dioxygenase [Roseomonas sp.]|nr:intradiol ring-cleavage dioxygenase [Roseomonas sp.]MCA3428078.1 intradiol ring-cleavage dioxygenase [Roseomonas sp.]MCA3433614.1 intradiol ring-cleavage dioxygenase [Roseomonas sp.]